MKSLSKAWRAVLVLVMGLAAAGSTAATVNAQGLEAQVAKNGTLTIGIANTWPWGFVSKDGEASGITPDLLKAVTKSMGVQKVNFVITDFGALIPSLQSRRIDAVTAGMAITPARCKEVAFSNPAFTGSNTVLVKKGNPLNIHSFRDVAMNSSIRLADMRGANSIAQAVAEGVSKDRIQLFADQTEEVSALVSGRVDAVSISVGTGLGLLKQSATTGIELAKPFSVSNEWVNESAIAFRPEDAKFRDQFDTELGKAIADGTVLKILESYGFSKSDLPPEGLTARKVCGDDYK